MRSDLLAVDADPAGGSQTLVGTELPNAWQVTHTTALGRVSTYHTEELPGGRTAPDEHRAGRPADDAARPRGCVAGDGHRRRDADAGYLGADPRFGMLAALPRSVVVQTPAGLTLTTTRTRTAVLTDPANVLRLQAQTDTPVVNGRTYRTVFDGATRTFTTTTPAGRTSTATIDARGRVTRLQTGSLTPVDFVYDAQGRLTTITQGTRQSTIAYDGAGRPATLTGALARTVRFGYDAADRVTTQTLPDLRTIKFAYDGGSNVTSLTPRVGRRVPSPTRRSVTARGRPGAVLSHR